jgi:hypothetical protein
VPVSVLAETPERTGVDPTDLFEEARRRRRRRRIVAATVVVFTVGATFIGVAVFAGGDHRHVKPASTSPATPPASRLSPSVTSGTTALAWIDYSGGLRVGTPGSGQDDRLVTSTVADATTPLVAIGSRVFFVESDDPSGSNVVDVDTATGREQSLGVGINVTTTTDRRDLLVALDAHRLVELSPTGRRLSPVWTVPAGYTLATYSAQRPLVAVAAGIAVQSIKPIRSTHVTPTTVDDLALWDPAHDSIRVLGPDVFVLGAYTPPGANHSLLAWVDGRPAGTASYRLAITDTTTLRTQLISSPIQSSAAEFGRNFVGGGGFSPDGRYLAAFVTSFRPENWPDAQLVLIDVANHAVEPIANTTVQIGEPQGWVSWSPTGSELFGGSYREGSVIQAFRLQIGDKRAVPLTLDPNADDDITVSAVALQTTVPKATSR